MFSVFLTLVVVAVPSLGSLIELVPLSLYHWAIALFLFLFIIVVIEVEKLILKKMGKKFLA